MHQRRVEERSEDGLRKSVEIGRNAKLSDNKNRNSRSNDNNIIVVFKLSPCSKCNLFLFG